MGIKKVSVKEKAKLKKRTKVVVAKKKVVPQATKKPVNLTRGHARNNAIVGYCINRPDEYSLSCDFDTTSETNVIYKRINRIIKLPNKSLFMGFDTLVEQVIAVPIIISLVSDGLHSEAFERWKSFGFKFLVIRSVEEVEEKLESIK